MSRFKNVSTGAIFSVDDSKDHRYGGPGYTDPNAPEPTPYDDLKAADLKAEIDERNDGREDDAKMSSQGSKADLIALLVADDDQ